MTINGVHVLLLAAGGGGGTRGGLKDDHGADGALEESGGRGVGLGGAQGGEDGGPGANAENRLGNG